MDIQLLKEAGLTDGEARVYEALLRLGGSTVGPIASEASVSLSKVYEILDGLIRKGLASHSLKNRVKIFRASDPDVLLGMLKEKEQRLSRAAEEVAKLRKLGELRKEVPFEIFEGFGGIRSYYEWIIRHYKRGDELCILGIPRYVAEEYDAYFQDWVMRRGQRGIKMRAIFEAAARDIAKKRLKSKFVEIRLLPEHMQTPAWVHVLKDMVAIMHMKGRGVCFVIRDNAIIESYRSYFEEIWKRSKRLSASD